MTKPVKVTIMMVSLALVIIIAQIDALTGFFPDFTILYLIPIIATVILAGLPYAVTVACLAAVALLTANVYRGIPAGTMLLLDASLHFLVFILAVILVDRLLVQFKSISELNQKREYDLSLAKKVQQSFFAPIEDNYKSYSVGSRITFAKELGGDFYYLSDVNDDLLFCIADISGKSVPAALFSALLHQSIEEALERSADISSLIRQVNATMYRALPEDMFITLFFCLFGKQRIAYVNAGHEPPLLYSKDMDKIRLLESQSPLPIGIEPDLSIEPVTSDFRAGDILLAVTDGITESKPFRNNPFAKLEELLCDNSSNNPQAIADTIYSTAIAETVGDLEDDVMVICIKYNP